MTNLFASEGGYQLFTLGRAEWFWLVFTMAVALLALVVGGFTMRGVLAKPTGTKEMGEIAEAVQEGAMAYITRQFRTIGIIVIPLAVIVFFTSSKVMDEVSNEGLTFAQSGGFRTVAFLVGGLASASIGFLGMWLSTRANIRTATAAKAHDMNGAMQVAFRAGGTVGLFTAGFGLVGATGIVMLF